MNLKGMKNLYLCDKCGIGFISQDIDEGVTPFMTSCIQPGCGGNATSFFYKVPQDWLRAPAVIEWYRPSPAETAALSLSSLDHVQKGGLLSRRAQRDD